MFMIRMEMKSNYQTISQMRKGNPRNPVIKVRELWKLQWTLNDKENLDGNMGDKIISKGKKCVYP